ncbi:MAG: patatin-like phospholipase RssA [Betaproteobacteria bacterium]|nr:patatin-like phospholipase RssA [Betaproteobacteria bacterium]MDH5221535.1 patatin-like phospholipase RssA [Betaproteobacteria bacterium]MDH5349454.1 patatin-like phospholipase RssA [Betaproteobacteria bacterium]
MSNPRKPIIGLALGAGGARGWAHLGVIRALGDAGIRADVVCGTSMGSLVGAAYAAGEVERLEDWALSLGWREVFGLMDFTWRGGLIRGKKLFEFMRLRFGLQDIAALPMPYGAVATELDTGREVWLREGHVLDAVRASIAIPGVFAPVLRDGELLVDGGLVNPVPVSMCRALGADLVIAVDLGWAKLGHYRERERGRPAQRDDGRPAWLERFLPTRAGSAAGTDAGMPSPLGVFFTSFDIMQVRVARSRLAGDPADVLITPILPDFAMMDFDRAREAIDEGRAATERARPVLEHLLGS